MPPAPPKPTKVEITDDMHAAAIKAATPILRTIAGVGPKDEFSSYAPGLATALRTQERVQVGTAIQAIVRREPLEPAEEAALRTKLVAIAKAYNDSIAQQTRVEGAEEVRGIV